MTIEEINKILSNYRVCILVNPEKEVYITLIINQDRLLVSRKLSTNKIKLRYNNFYNSSIFTYNAYLVYIRTLRRDISNVLQTIK